ncbi:reverse transcriptase domain-containing protein, partial [Flavobacterium davisii]
MKLDLSQAYFHVPVAKTHRRFLRFSMSLPTSKVQFWQMTCLPFGLASALKVFSTLTNWVALKLRERGMRVLVYLDDFLLVNQCPHMLQDHFCQATDLLRGLGWLINVEKSSTESSQMLNFLGIQWNTRKNQKALPMEKLSKLDAFISTMLKTPKWSVFHLQQIVGLLNFASFVV